MVERCRVPGGRRGPGAVVATHAPYAFVRVTAETTAAASEPRPRAGIRRAVGGIAALNLAVTATAFVTSPILARVLGPTGRGDLAAVLTTLGLAPLIAGLGLTNYTARATARGESVRRIVGTAGLLGVALGLVVALLSPLIAGLVAGDRERIRTLLIVGLATMPVVVAGTVLMGVNWGRSNWRTWSLVRAIPPFGGLVATVALWATGHLTVTTAALSAIVLSVLAVLPMLPILWRFGRPIWDAATARAALGFGSKVWLWSIAAEANNRLDQLLMTRLVPARELGLYVIAVNISTMQTALTASVLNVTYPRVSAGDAALVARALRTTLTLIALGALVLEAVVGFAIPLAFGSDFEPAVEMTRILLLAAIPQTATQVLSSALVASGAPGVTARGQLFSLAITVPGLILLLGPLGGVGAALVSLAAYSATAAYLLWQAHRRLQLGFRAMLLVRAADLTSVLRPLLSRLWWRRR